MLYDPKWEIEIKADPFSLESLIAWLEKQPADKAYEFTDCAGCALAQYFEYHGFRNVNMGTQDFDHGADFEHTADLPDGWNDIVNPDPPEYGKWTFGAALDRARRLAAA